jgi:hypothetical protein
MSVVECTHDRRSEDTAGLLHAGSASYKTRRNEANNLRLLVTLDVAPVDIIQVCVCEYGVNA